MTRQRLTIEADAVYVEAHDYWHLTGPGGQRQTFVPGWAVTDAEPLTEPLPTEPGVRFWGQIPGYEAGWFFVAERLVSADSIRIKYVSWRGGEVTQEEAAFSGLVRLPDPEVIP